MKQKSILIKYMAIFLNIDLMISISCVKFVQSCLDNPAWIQKD